MEVWFDTILEKRNMVVFVLEAVFWFGPSERLACGYDR